MAHTLLTSDIVLNECLEVLHNNLVFVRSIDKQHDKKTTIAGHKTGGSIRIRKPSQFTVRETWTMDAQDVVEEYDTLTIGVVRGIDIPFTEAERALSLTRLSENFITPAMAKLAAIVDSYCIGAAYADVFQSVGTPGTTPASALVYLQAKQKLMEASVPDTNLQAVINPAAEAATVNGLSSLFHARSALEEQYLKGKMGHAMGLDFSMSQQVPTHTCGSRAGTILVDDAAGTYLTEGSSSLHVDGLTGATNTFTEGDVFTIADVYAVNPETKVSTGSLQQFVVTADATAASNEVTLSISPAFRSSGARQNVDALPADNAAITVVGTASTVYPQNLVYYPQAFTFATANLSMPSDVSFKAQKSYDGINMRILKGFDLINSVESLRIDVFFGFLTQRPEMACRLWG